MPAISSTWDETVPPGSEALTNGEDRIREDKLCTRERLRNGGHRMQTSGATTDAKDARHVCNESNAAGSGEAVGTWNVYASDGTTIIFTIGDTTATPASTISAATLALSMNNLTLSGTLSVGCNYTLTGKCTTDLATTVDNLKDLGLAKLPSTLDQYERSVVSVTLQKEKAGGAVGTKFEAAYLRSLDFGEDNPALALAVYNRFAAGGVPFTSSSRKPFVVPVTHWKR